MDAGWRGQDVRDQADGRLKGGREVSGIEVECYSGCRAHERPLRFALSGVWRQVTEIEDRWYGPSSLYFRVRADDGDTYVLRYDEDLDVWTLEAYRRA